MMNKYVNEKPKHKLFLGIIIFLFLYMPPLFKINLIYIIAAISWCVLLFKFRNSFTQLLKNRYIMIFCLGLSSSLILLICTLLFTTKNFQTLKLEIIVLTCVLPVSILITLMLKKYKFKIDDIFLLLLNVGLFQSLLVILTFLYPDFRQLILNKFYYEEYVISDISWITERRIYGFSYGLTFAMPVVQSFMALVALVYSLRKSIFYIIYIPPLLFSSALNARTGLLIFFIGILIIIFININKLQTKIVLRIMIVLLSFLLLTPIIFNVIIARSEESAVWLLDAYNETKAFIAGEEVGYYNAVSNMLFFPPKETIFTGSGKDVFFNVQNSSDIGYVNDLFLGGIFFTIILYFSYLFFLISGRFKGHWQHQNFSILMPLLMIILNVKGLAFTFNNFTNLFILISVILIYDRVKNVELNV